MTKLEWLAKVSILDGVSPAVLERLASACRARNLASGQVLFYEGDEGSTMCIVVKGKVSVQRRMADGSTLHVADRGPGEHVGELSLIDGEPRSADVVAVEPSEVLALNKADFERAVADSPDLALGIMKALARRIREQSERLAKTAVLDALGKLCLLLIELADEHGVVRMSQSAMATRINVSRETVNRSLNQLQSVGAISIAGRSVHLEDRKFLHERAR